MEMKSTKVATEGSGMVAYAIVQLVFLYLKLTSSIDWSLWWVFSPVLMILFICLIEIVFEGIAAIARRIE